MIRTEQNLVYFCVQRKKAQKKLQIKALPNFLFKDILLGFSRVLEGWRVDSDQRHWKGSKTMVGGWDKFLCQFVLKKVFSVFLN